MTRGTCDGNRDMKHGLVLGCKLTSSLVVMQCLFRI